MYTICSLFAICSFAAFKRNSYGYNLRFRPQPFGGVGSPVPTSACDLCFASVTTQTNARFRSCAPNDYALCGSIP